MIEVPAGLASWAAQLAVLPSDLALALAPWVGRLSLAMGPLAATQRRRSGEPDGYAGLARRGSYERLVAAEWALADVYPDEFLRRAAAGEHLFLDLARSEPRGALRSIAIVSAGPSQLGAPRLAHLAALIVLARRAALAGAAFAWGVLEDREHRLNDGLDEAGIQRLLGARTAVPAEPDALARWLDALGGDAARDLWFIGDDEGAATAPELGASRMCVRDVLEPNTRALEVDVERRGTTSRVRLDLPTPDVCARLLRAPFAGRGGAPSRVARDWPAREVRFAPGGRKLIVRLSHGVIEAWPVPGSPRDSLGHPRLLRPPRRHVVVAVGVGRRAVLAATASRDDPTALELRYGSSNAIRLMLPNDLVAELSDRLAGADTVPLGTCGLIRFRQRHVTDLVLDVLGRLLVVPGFSVWPARGAVFSTLPFNTGALAVATAFFARSVVWAERHADGQVHLLEATERGNQRVAALHARGEPDVHFGFATPRSDSWGVVSIAGDTMHRCVAAPNLEPIAFGCVDPVVGVCLREGVPSLLTRPSPHRLAWLTGDRRTLLPTATAPIVAVAVCPAQPNVAWVTDAGELVVYSMQHEAVLFRRAVGEGT